MRRFFAIASCVALFCGAIFARSGMQAPPQGAAPASSETKIIDLKSDLSGPVAPGDSAIFLVGNFAAQHNGAVITCDSAVRYSDKRIEFFGNVLINKNTTYIYGDRADYNGEINEARIYSPIIKVVDGDATLYTYRFSFNTKENIGEFADGGVLTNRDNLLESVRGYYYADTKELVAVGQVEMRNDEYELKGDSVVYDMASDNAYFFEHTHIWSSDGNYLYADRGEYRKADTLYLVTRNGYVLTDEQELWSDSIDFYRAENHVILRSEIQIDDTTHKVLAFGDYGEYWKEPGNALLTRRPAVVSYDRSQGDSLFMRADSILLLTLRPGAETAETAAPEDAASGNEDAAAGEETSTGDDAAAEVPHGDRMPELPGLQRDSLRTEAADSAGIAAVPDSLAVVDSLAADTLPQLTPAERKALLKVEARKAKEAKKKAAAAAKKELLAEIAAERQAKATAKLLAQKEREEARLVARRLKAESKLRARLARKGKVAAVDSAALQRFDEQLARNAAEQDSLYRILTEEWVADSIEMSAADDTLALQPLPRDSICRLILGYRDVRIYRSDFQSVCDSMTVVGTDSTIHLYIEPVLWNDANQITSEVMDIYTRDSRIERAEFVGSPMMVSEIDTVHYNQIAGKEMTAYFRNNEIWLDNVNGNAQTLYYNQDGEPPEITGLFFVESGGINFYVDENRIVRMVWYNEPHYSVSPMDKLQPGQELYLKGFKWEGARRPSQRDVFDRRIRPSEREERAALRHPDFPLQRRLEEQRRTLVEQRRWADRVDQVDPATAEWMLLLGFEVGQPRTEGPAF
ncbi:MAG: hypothetical protein NC209_01210 [Alistipes sp.]|nr:hypothetical protein [Alistipes senegalensis]MCM1249752.1 hypothetical protein [Alistipes sp.]